MHVIPSNTEANWVDVMSMPSFQWHLFLMLCINPNSVCLTAPWQNDEFSGKTALHVCIVTS